MTDVQKANLLNEILPHVAFDGWSQTAFSMAVQGLDMTMAEAKEVCPRGAVDLAIAFHKKGDAKMVADLATTDLTELRFRDKVATAIRLRLVAVDDKEAVRRGTTLFAMPHMAADGAKLIWGTSDAIWNALGDISRDVNWYSKRMTLSAVYASVVLFWLGDDSLEEQATNAFIDRRIEDVMKFEQTKARINDNPLLKPFAGAVGRVLSGIKAPGGHIPDDLPGIWKDPK